MVSGDILLCLAEFQLTLFSGSFEDSFHQLENDVAKVSQLYGMSRIEERWASLWASHSTLSERILLRGLNATINGKRSSLTPTTTPAPVTTCQVVDCKPTVCEEVPRLTTACPEKACQEPVCVKQDCSSALNCARHVEIVCPKTFCSSIDWLYMTDFNCSAVTLPSRARVYDAVRTTLPLCLNTSAIFPTTCAPPVACAEPVCTPCNCSSSIVVKTTSAPPTTVSPALVCRCPTSAGTTASLNDSQVAVTATSATPAIRTTRSVLFSSFSQFVEKSVPEVTRCAELPLLIVAGVLTAAFLVLSAVIFGLRWSLHVRHQEIIRLTRIIELNELNGWIGEFDEGVASKDNIPQFYN